MPRLARLSPSEAEAALPDLARLMHAAVEAGASVNFVLPFALSEAEAWWTDAALPGLRSGKLILFAARDDTSLVGCVMLAPATQPNQPHRADVTKLLVHPRARRQGLATRLMAALEAEARTRGLTLLTLDTWTGDGAETLYRGLGFIEAGRIPQFFQHPVDRSLQSTTLFYKVLA